MTLYITADSEGTAKEIKDLLKTFLNERCLELSDDKTLITHIVDGSDFLGWNFRKTRGKLLIKPSKESIQRFVNKVSQTIKTGKSWSQELLISKINPIIREVGLTIIAQLSPLRFSVNLTIYYGKCYGNGQKDDILTNPNDGLQKNIGSKAILVAGTFKQKTIGYCSYLIPKSKDIFL